MITFKKLGKLGRWGNQLFQYSGTRLYAELNGFEYSFPNWIGNEIFDIRSGPLGFRHHFLPTIQLADMASTSWSERILRPLGFWRRSGIEELYQKPQDNINLYGYMQDRTSLQLLKAEKSKIREWFVFKKEIDEIFRRATDKYRPWIGVHIRRGDFVKRRWAIPAENYIRLIKELGRERNVYIASDDRSIAKEFSEFCPFTIENPLPETKDIFDFWMLIEADIVLGCGSTFSWWAAYLGNKNDYYSPPLTHLWQHGYEPKLEKIDI